MHQRRDFDDMRDLLLNDLDQSLDRIEDPDRDLAHRERVLNLALVALEPTQTDELVVEAALLTGGIGGRQVEVWIGG